jgi:hypothetical protein
MLSIKSCLASSVRGLQCVTGDTEKQKAQVDYPGLSVLRCIQPLEVLPDHHPQAGVEEYEEWGYDQSCLADDEADVLVVSHFTLRQ